MKQLHLSAIILVTALCLSSTSHAQFDKELKKLLKAAEEYFSITDYWNALNSYKELYPLDSTSDNMNYKMGVCYFKLGKEQPLAQGYFEKIKEKNNFVEAYLYSAQLYHKKLQFDEAISQYQRYQQSAKKELPDEEINRLIDISTRAKEMLAHPIAITIENVGNNINTAYPDYVPLITADESMMIFTSRREGSTGGELDPYNRFFEDIYYTTNSNEQWSDATNMGLTINTSTHDACVGLSSSGNLLILFRTNAELTGGDLYISELQHDAWAIPEKINEQNINTEWIEASASLSADDRLMYFSSNRPGGYGGKDIYRAIRFGNDEWSLPINLGPNINTPYDDDAPFIHPDGKTLYFSSKGHNTIGGYDIFKSIADEKEDWSEPENMGYPLNTVDDDIYFVLSANGQRGYFSSEREGGYGSQDIYVANMIEKPTPVVKGTVVRDDASSHPVNAKITLVDMEANEVVGIYHSNAKTGKYIMIVDLNKDYEIIVEADEYKTFTETTKFTEETLGTIKKIKLVKEK